MSEKNQFPQTIVQGKGELIQCRGDWITTKIDGITQQFRYLKYVAAPQVEVDASAIQKMDTVGAWILNELITQLKSANKKVTLQGLSKEHQTIYTIVQKQKPELIEEPLQSPRPHEIYFLGKATVDKIIHMLSFLSFIGELTIDLGRAWMQPRYIQWRSFLNVIDFAGVRALPIVGLLLFLIGIVISYQTALQLKNFGGNIYIVSLTGVAIVQEFGPLITAIIVAGRTGSSFTSQLGSMKINQEIDALNTMGLSPFNMLVLPRFFGLLVTLPLLIVWADIFGVFGSMVMAKHVLDFNYMDYLLRFPRDIRIYTLIIGMSKAPVYAMIIATVGCFQGFQVTTGAASVGERTTKSVVQAIFLIIIADAIFSVLFSWG